MVVRRSPHTPIYRPDLIHGAVDVGATPATPIQRLAVATSAWGAWTATVSGIVYYQVLFTYTGGNQSFTVPSGVTSLVIRCRGSQGNSDGSSAGGLGAEVMAHFPVTPGTQFDVVVGGFSGNTPWPNGGAAGVAGAFAAKCGGGSSSVVVNGDPFSSSLIVAGGGGGSGDGSASKPNPAGGHGGYLTGGNSLGDGAGNGHGATVGAGGTGGPGTDGAANAGGAGESNGNSFDFAGGGGGGGWYGGEGGSLGVGGNGQSGGGGGSGHVDGTATGVTSIDNSVSGTGTILFLVPV